MLDTLYDLQALSSITYRYDQSNYNQGTGTTYRRTAKVIEVSEVREFERDGKLYGHVDMIVELENGKKVKTLWRGYGSGMPMGRSGKPNPFYTILEIS